MQNNKKNILRSKKNTLAIKNILQNTLNCKIKEIKFKGIERIKYEKNYIDFTDNFFCNDIFR